MKIYQKKQNFTLFELLVVIGIIGILMSLFLPSLHYAKNKAKEASCLNNERSIGSSVQLFISDNEGRIKPSFAKTAVIDIDTVYEAYVDDAKVFNCPGRSDDEGIYLSFNDKIVRCQYAVFSPFNYIDAYQIEGNKTSPSNVRLIGEAIPPSYGYHWLAEKTCPWNNSAEYRHSSNRRMNIIYADGSGMSEGIIPIDEKLPGRPPYIKGE